MNKTVHLGLEVKKKPIESRGKADAGPPTTSHITMKNLSIYLYTLAVSPSLGGSRQHKGNNKNNGGFTPFFQQ